MCGEHLKVPGWFSDLNALLTRKLPTGMFLSHLNEMRGDRGNICNDIFDCKVLWMVGEGEWNSVGFFLL